MKLIPDEIAKAMANLILPTDQKVLEPNCGKGEIIRHLPRHIDLWALETNYRKLSSHLERGGLMDELGLTYDLQNYNFLGRSMEPSFIMAPSSFVKSDFVFTGWDVIVSKPPHPKTIAYIERSLALLNPNYPEARIIFLLPLAWNCTEPNASSWQRLDAHIHREYRIVGDKYKLTSYKQFAAFDIRPGRVSAAVDDLKC